MIPSAKDFAILFKHDPTHTWEQKLASVMVEFAKLHVKEALEEANKNAKVVMNLNCSDHTPYRGVCNLCGNYGNYETPTENVDQDSILNAYPLNNIK